VRTQEHNRFVEQRIQEIAGEARSIIEERERREIVRIKGLIRDYYRTREESTKRAFEEANSVFPFLFSRAWRELKAQKSPPTPPPVAAPDQADDVRPPTEVFYPLDTELRERVMEIERIIIELGQDLQRLKAQGDADDILLQMTRKLVLRAKETLSGREASDFNAKRLGMMRDSLMTTWRQVRSRLKS
jgi:hypothetical protein